MLSKRSETSPLLQALAGRRPQRPPFWFMRQAGRYLPEYRAVREQAGSFLELVCNPPLASEVTLQPVRRFGTDAAILFSDILVLPYALGQALTFAAGEGPRLEAVACADDLERLKRDGIEARFAPVYETVERVAGLLPREVALLGFCGGLWTVASYMVAGRGGDEQAAAKRWAYRDPEGFGRLLELLLDASVSYLAGQVRAGADALMIFDSWAGNLAEPLFESLVIAPTRRLVDEVKRRVGEIPIIGFPRGCGALLERYVRETGVDAVSLDSGMPIGFADRVLPSGFPIQGNLDPQVVVAGGVAMRKEAARIIDGLSGRPHIFNLGHGFVPETPVEHVAELAELLKGRDSSKR